jgi:hypothetical protein
MIYNCHIILVQTFVILSRNLKIYEQDIIVLYLKTILSIHLLSLGKRGAEAQQDQQVRPSPYLYICLLVLLDPQPCIIMLQQCYAFLYFSTTPSIKTVY